MAPSAIFPALPSVTAPLLLIHPPPATLMTLFRSSSRFPAALIETLPPLISIGPVPGTGVIVGESLVQPPETSMSLPMRAMSTGARFVPVDCVVVRLIVAPGAVTLPYSWMPASDVKDRDPAGARDRLVPTG